MFTLDVDCLCRSTTIGGYPSKHTSEQDIRSLTLAIINVLKSLIPNIFVVNKLETEKTGGRVRKGKVDRFRFIYSWWRNKCGYHFYSNLPVSLPLHQCMLQMLVPATSDLWFKLEVPSIMPLPYSSKVLNQPYKLLFEITDDEIENFCLLPSDDASFYDNIVYTSRQNEAIGNGGYSYVGCIERFNKDCIYIYRTLNVNIQTFIPNVFGDVNIFQLSDKSAEYLQQFAEFVDNAVTVSAAHTLYENENQSLNIACDTDKITRVCKALMDISNITCMDLKELTQNVLNNLMSEKFCEFILAFNTSHFNENNDSNVERFIKVALGHGALYLLHYVVALHMCLEMDDDNFRSYVLDPLFLPLGDTYSELLCGDETVEQFINSYDKEIKDAYTIRYGVILKELSFYYTTMIKPTMSISESINAAMSVKMNCTQRQFIAQLDAAPKDHKRKLIRECLKTYTSILLSMRLLVYNESVNLWYMLTDSGAYRDKTNKLELCLPCINIWTNYYSKTELVNQLQNEDTVSKFKLTYLWSRSRFMFSTQVGVFNSITGLYCARTGLLRFDKCRNYGLLAPESLHLVDNNQTMVDKNHQTVKHTMNNFKMKFGIAKTQAYNQQNNCTLEQRYSDLFVHFSLIPAVLQLTATYCVEDIRIISFLKILESHKSLESAYFLIEYHQIDPKFVAFIMILYTEFGVEDVATYALLMLRVFSYKCGQTIINDEHEQREWRQHYKQIVDDIEYTEPPPSANDDDDDQTGRYMKTLMSLKYQNSKSEANALDFLNERLCFISTLLCVCLIKCNDFVNLTAAANCSRLPKPDDEVPLRFVARKFLASSRLPDTASIEDLRNFLTVEKSAKSAKLAMKRAIYHVFGKNLTKFEQNLMDMIFMTSMSVCFNYTNFKELLISISTIFVTENVNKKVIVFYGPQNTGKTKFCDLIMNAVTPDCARFLNVTEASKRASVTTTNNVTLINEMDNVSMNKFKSISGNDAESKKIFLKQSYEMKETQSLVFGATNNCIRFNGHRASINKTTVARIHALKLDGRQYMEQADNETIDAPTDLLMMLTERMYYHDVISSTKKVEPTTNSMLWLAFCYYERTRNTKYRPMINVNISDSYNYRDRVYMHNNELYSFMKKCGLSEVTNMHIPMPPFKSIIKGGVEAHYSRNIKEYPEFVSQFQQQFNIQNFSDMKVVPNFQQTAFIMHVKESMATVPTDGKHITETDLENRLKMYSNKNEITNARAYFNQHYGHLRTEIDSQCVFKNIRFANIIDSSYSGNTSSKSEVSLYNTAALSDDRSHSSFDSRSQHSLSNMLDLIDQPSTSAQTSLVLEDI
uniref:Helicase n=1 Tax=Nilaparvata lugens endogenous nudivirus TaxID=1487700 RepID=X5G6M4_9VIRU|nr:helicase [Nilaparvata lugens endogenous nudivirus]